MSAKEMSAGFVAMIDEKMDELYPLKKITIKSTDDQGNQVQYPL